MSAITLTEANFEKEVNHSDLPVLVSYEDNRSPYTAADAVDKVSESMNGALKCCKINVNTNPTLATKYQIRSVPTMLLFKHGKVTDTIVGKINPEQLMKILK
ncbi:MAG: thioredoxin family protein [Oscillospiraceae bacterium]|nr:thioredoxin family protein [Oscillospiraceae bacterium]